MVKRLFSRPEASRAYTPRWGAWQCAGSSLLVLLGLIAFNLAGCGGGGGGGKIVPHPDVRIDLRNTAGGLVSGTIHLKGVSISFDQTLSAPNGIATFTDLKTGHYLVTVTYDTGTPTSQTEDLFVGIDSQQVFVMVQGVTGVSGAGIRVSGTIFSGTPTCDASSLGVAAEVLVRVRKLDPRQGNPIVASFIKPFNSSNAGEYTIFNIPGTGSYIVEVRQAPSTPTDPTSPFCGQSSAFFVSSTDTVITGRNICANADNCLFNPTPPAPGGTPTPTPGVPPPG